MIIKQYTLFKRNAFIGHIFADEIKIIDEGSTLERTHFLLKENLIFILWKDSEVKFEEEKPSYETLTT